MGSEPKGDRFTEFAKEFIRLAKHDLLQAEKAFANSDFSDVLMYSQQSSEKIAKALLEMEKHFESIHDVSDIFYTVIIKDKKYKQYENELNTVRKYIRWLAFHWQKSRYPIWEHGGVVSPLDRYDRTFAESALDKVRFVFKIISMILHEKHNI